jgi:branched-chain amino acid transport system substrate-binding protein
MIENEHILAFVGNVIVFEYDQIEAVAKKAGVPIIGGDGASPGWFESTVTFPVASPAPTQIAKGLRYLIDGGADKLGIEYCLEVSSVCKYLNDAVMETPEGKNVVQNDQVSLVAPSYTSQCIRLKQKGVSGVVLLMDSAGASRFAENCATQGYTPKYSILSLDATSDLPKAAILDGAIVPGATFPPTAQGVPAIADFRAGMLQYAPGIGYSGLASASWAAAQVMLKASKFLDKVNPQRSQLFEGLWTVKNDTFGGLTVPLTFNKNAPATKSTCVFIWGLKDGAFTAPREAKVVC